MGSQNIMTPWLSRSEAKKLHIAAYDGGSGFATIKLADLSLSRACHLHAAVELVEIVRQVLLLCAKSECLQGWEEELTVAGSAPLAIVESIIKQSEMGELCGRWARANNIKWKCNDVDLFVSGQRAEDDASFRRFDRKFSRALARTCGQRGISLVSRQRYKHRYVIRDRSVNIVQYRFAEINLSLQLVQAPTDANSAEVVDRFDMDIVQVMLNPLTGLIHAPLETMRNVMLGRAVLNVGAFWPDKGGSFEIVKASSSKARIEKYKQRGYVFDDAVVDALDRRLEEFTGFYSGNGRAESDSESGSNDSLEMHSVGMFTDESDSDDSGSESSQAEETCN